jgi:hypothetical protein
VAPSRAGSSRGLRSLALLLAVLVAAAGWAAVNRQRLARQWACYRVGAAETFDAANREILWFEQGPDRRGRLDELVAKWGTGNPRFDLFLAHHVAQPASSEDLKAAFAARVGRDERLLTRWAHFWLWRAPLEPDVQAASILHYHDALLAAGEPTPITWREVLDLQALFVLCDRPDRAAGLSPETWRDRYRVFRESAPERLPELVRPEQPLPDWHGPLPH